MICFHLTGKLFIPGSWKNGCAAAISTDRIELSPQEIRGVRGESTLELFSYPREDATISVREGKWVVDYWKICHDDVEWRFWYSARPVDFCRTRLTAFDGDGPGSSRQFMPRRKDIREALEATGWS